MSADSWPPILLSAIAIGCAAILTLIQRRLARRDEEWDDARGRWREKGDRFHER